MSISDSELIDRAEAYAEQNNLYLSHQLGGGIHGIVWAAGSHLKSSRILALKVFERLRPYQREREVYLRLKEYDVETIRTCQVPRMLDYNDDLLALSMTIVSRPFVLDFAAAYLDDPPEFTEEVWADWRVEKEKHSDRIGRKCR